MMRVLHFLPVYAPAWQFGGPVLSVSRLCEGLVQQGIDIRVITTNAGLPELPIHQLGIPQIINGVEVIYYPVDSQNGIIRSRALVQELPAHMAWAELLHLSAIWQPLGLPVQKAAHDAGVPVIHTLRGALGPYSWRRGWWKKIPYFWLREKPVLQKADILHCTTYQELHEINWLRLTPTTRVVPNPIDLSYLSYDRTRGNHFREKANIPSDAHLFLVAGRLHHKKGLDLLPKVLSTITRKPWHILFLGSDEDGTGSLLRNKFRRLNLHKHCHWMPSIPADQLSDVYNAANCLLLPSRHENFGNVVIEALACGASVLVSDKVGVVEMLNDCPGVFVSPRTASSFAKKTK